MPYKSQAQRGWAHTEEGEKALGGPAAVHEWDEASKGKKLPEKVKKMDDGGLVTPDQNDLVNQWLAQEMAQRPGGPPIAGPSPAPAGGTPPPPTDIVPRETAGSGESAAMSGSRDPDGKIADSHPGLQPDELTPYIKGQEQQVDTFGPAQQAALMRHLQQGYRSPGNILAKGGATLADAIMQGVARAGSGGNLSAINEREQQNLNRTADLGKALNEQQQEALKTKQGLEAMTAKSPLGSTEALATQLLAKKMFPDLSDAQLQKLTQNPQALSKFFPSIAEYNKAMAEIQASEEFRKAQLGLQAATLQNTEQHERTQEQLTQQNQMLQHPILSKIFGLGSGVAGTAAPQKITSQAQYDALPKGTTYLDHNGTARIKQ